MTEPKAVVPALQPKPKALLLFHGAGGDVDHHTFDALESGLDIPVIRGRFYYRRLGGRRPPDRMPKLLTALNEVADEACADLGIEPDELVLGGRSMGGRAATVAVAEGRRAFGVVALSYPLHPPKKPEKLRTDHWDRVTVPVLICQGTKDPMGRHGELEDHLDGFAGPVTVEWLEGANHDPKRHDDQIVAAVARWLATENSVTGT